MAMSDSGVIWEEKSEGRKSHRSLGSSKLIEEVEAAYQKWTDSGRPTGFARLEASGMEVDFSNSILRKKPRVEVKLRRSHRNGLWLQHRQSDHQTQIHVKLNHLQVDNQLPACVFPCVLAVIPPPKNENEGLRKPFVEFSFVMSASEHSNVVQIKYLKLLVQEFAVRIDNGLINAAMALFEAELAAMPPYSVSGVV